LTNTSNKKNTLAEDNGTEFPTGNSFKLLNLFLDGDRVLRVGGRIENAEKLLEELKHSVILPKKSKLPTLIIEDAHVRFKHAQTQHLTSIISNQYCIVSLRPQVCRYIKKLYQVSEGRSSNWHANDG
jgi:hypothetical protein